MSEHIQETTQQEDREKVARKVPEGKVWLPLVPLRNMILFPDMTMNFDVGRLSSAYALETAMRSDQLIMVTMQKDPDQEEPALDDLHKVGCIARILQAMNLPGGYVRILVEGVVRAELLEEKKVDGYTSVLVETRLSFCSVPETELAAILQASKEVFDIYVKTSQKVTNDMAESILMQNDANVYADLLASGTLTSLTDRQEILGTIDIAERLKRISRMHAQATEIASLEQKILAQVHDAVEKNQKDYYLREQIRAYQNELGETESTELDELRERLARTPMNEEARTKCSKEIERMSRMAPGSPEMAISLNYVEWILEMPWEKTTEDNLDLDRARKVLNDDHYGLEKVKERIIEYLAVLQVKRDLRGPILCFVGPPGVGKTSIVRAIAKAVGREFIQMSLGGVRDEAEIRGHRRTYLGSIPGRIISGIRHAGVMNPVFLFDEIDKMSSDLRGDPASAMLEVLDSEQNMSFRDHYMEIPFDLSKVMFITTANSAETIPAPLLDRMEIIEVPSYTEEEKLHISTLHLFPKQAREHGLKADQIQISSDIMRSVIEGYTREAGVRTLERVLAKIVRKSVVEMLDTHAVSITIDAGRLHNYLGATRYTREMPEKRPLIGTVVGLAYTQVGGETLEVECTVMPGKGVLTTTGKLGDVMKESAQAAFSWVRAHSRMLGIDDDFYQKTDLHIHIPEGAVDKDGPSAGVTLITSIVSALTSIPVRQDTAMTGEITLRGRVLPIGGLKEKTLAAYRAGIQTLILPRENMKDLEEIPAHVISQFRVTAVDTIEEVLREALTELPKGWDTPHA